MSMHDVQKYNPTERFSDRAKHYSQARPNYAEEAIAFICQRCKLTGESTVCDIGSGTGISTRAFAARGMHAVGIEPNDAMRTEASNNPDFKEQIEYRKGTAENSGLEPAIIDAVICAQAFHWFDPQKAIREFDRILKAGGWIVLIWNERDESDPFTKNYGDLLRTWPDTMNVESKRGEAGIPLLNCEFLVNRQKDLFYHDQEMDLDKLLGRALSASYAPKPDSKEAARFCDKLSELFSQYQKDGTVLMKYECSVFTAQKP